jgi:hypothetical protein
VLNASLHNNIKDIKAIFHRLIFAGEHENEIHTNGPLWSDTVQDISQKGWQSQQILWILPIYHDTVWPNNAHAWLRGRRLDFFPDGTGREAAAQRRSKKSRNGRHGR